MWVSLVFIDFAVEKYLCTLYTPMGWLCAHFGHREQQSDVMCQANYIYLVLVFTRSDRRRYVTHKDRSSKRCFFLPNTSNHTEFHRYLLLNVVSTKLENPNRSTLRSAVNYKNVIMYRQFVHAQRLHILIPIDLDFQFDLVIYILSIYVQICYIA